MNLQVILQKNTDEVLQSLGFEGMSAEEKKQAMAQLEDHFTKIIVETLVVNLDDDLLAEFKEGFEHPTTDKEELVTELSAKVPGLLEKIEIAVKKEFMTLAAAKRIVDR